MRQQDKRFDFLVLGYCKLVSLMKLDGQEKWDQAKEKSVVFLVLVYCKLVSLTKLDGQEKWDEANGEERCFPRISVPKTTVSHETISRWAENVMRQKDKSVAFLVFVQCKPQNLILHRVGGGTGDLQKNKKMLSDKKTPPAAID